MSPNEALTSTEAADWRAANHAVVADARRQMQSRTREAFSSVNLLPDREAYVDAHIDDDDDSGAYGFDRDWVGE